MKDINVVNLKALGRNQHNFAIVCSAFSMRHSYSTAKTLVQRVKELKCPEIKNLPGISGLKDESWLLVAIKEVQVHFLIEEYRDELNLEFRWMNPPPPEMHKKWSIYNKLKKKGQSLQVDETTF
jgi:ribosomal silencing factor RsfS